MQLRLEEDKDAKTSGRNKHAHGRFGQDNGGTSEFTSTFHSIDLPPEEYETQLQDYEAEVRNHIKVEQQLKLHIEVLQEKIDDLEKEKKEWEAKTTKEKAVLEKKLKNSFQKLMDQKQIEIAKLQDQLERQQEIFNGSFERSRVGHIETSSNQGHSTQVKVVRVNNFVGG